MTDEDYPPSWYRAVVAKVRLVDAYREAAAELEAAASALEEASVRDLLARPVRHLHSGCRALEDRLDAALAALEAEGARCR